MSDFNDRLRHELNRYVESSGESYYKVANGAGVSTQIIYSLRGGSGVSAENAAKLVNYMGIELESLIDKK